MALKIGRLRNALYDTALIPMLPKVIYQLAHHDYSQVAAVSQAANAALGSDSVGMFYSVECSESTLTPQAMADRPLKEREREEIVIAPGG